jgi:hypothetical protein
MWSRGSVLLKHLAIMAHSPTVATIFDITITDTTGTCIIMNAKEKNVEPSSFASCAIE